MLLFPPLHPEVLVVLEHLWDQDFQGVHNFPLHHLGQVAHEAPLHQLSLGIQEILEIGKCTII